MPVTADLFPGQESPRLRASAVKNLRETHRLVLGLDFGSYLTGSILTETIFSWPGVGRYVLTAIEKRDLPAVQGSILFLSVVFVLVNLVTDLAYAKADPRVSHE